MAEHLIRVVYRKNLKLTPGKLAAQCVHAVTRLGLSSPPGAVVVIGLSDKRYFETVEAASGVFRFFDAGRTEVAPNTETCAAYVVKTSTAEE